VRSAGADGGLRLAGKCQRPKRFIAAARGAFLHRAESCRTRADMERIGARIAPVRWDAHGAGAHPVWPHPRRAINSEKNQEKL